MNRITPFLWFNANAEEAVNFYLSVFKNSRIVDTTRHVEGGPGPTGSVMTIRFQLDGKEFVALNGGPQFTFSEAISFVVNCDTQEEIDHFWERLSAGGQTIECGWLKDRFGVAWQVVPTVLWQMLQDKDAARTGRVMTALWQMKKLDIAGLHKAYDQG